MAEHNPDDRNRNRTDNGEPENLPGQCRTTGKERVVSIMQVFTRYPQKRACFGNFGGFRCISRIGCCVRSVSRGCSRRLVCGNRCQYRRYQFVHSCLGGGAGNLAWIGHDVLPGDKKMAIFSDSDFPIAVLDISSFALAR